MQIALVFPRREQIEKVTVQEISKENKVERDSARQYSINVISIIS